MYICVFYIKKNGIFDTLTQIDFQPAESSITSVENAWARP